MRIKRTLHFTSLLLPTIGFFCAAVAVAVGELSTTTSLAAEFSSAACWSTDSLPAGLLMGLLVVLSCCSGAASFVASVVVVVAGTVSTVVSAIV